MKYKISYTWLETAILKYAEKKRKINFVIQLEKLSVEEGAIIINSNVKYSSFSLKLPKDLIINKVIVDIQYFLYVSYSICDVIVYSKMWVDNLHDYTSLNKLFLIETIDIVLFSHHHSL